ncbi:MAG: hypothetical protein HY291_01825 [Planctomycetes bacterium]|nr:hypothetical protein [Planctomycetota bacterium]
MARTISCRAGLCGLLLLGLTAATRPALAQDGGPSPYAGIPENAVFETKHTWKFDDDRLVFSSASANPDGRRYFVWKDYNWIVSGDSIALLDTRPYGTSLTSSRHAVDEDGRGVPDKKIMNDMKDQAKDIRESREPRAYYGPYVSGPHIDFEFRGGRRFHHHGSGGRAFHGHGFRGHRR